MKINPTILSTYIICLIVSFFWCCNHLLAKDEKLNLRNIIDFIGISIICGVFISCFWIFTLFIDSIIYLKKLTKCQKQQNQK